MRSIKSTLPVDIKGAITSRIKGHVAIAGIGNILRGDDGLGQKLIEILKAKPIRASLFNCGTVPENYIFPILSIPCDTVILVDAADMGLAPGKVKVFDLEALSGVSFSTHNPSPHLFTDLLKMGRGNLNIFVVCMQPKTTTLGAALTKEVKAGLDDLANAFLEILA